MITTIPASAAPRFPRRRFFGQTQQSMLSQMYAMRDSNPVDPAFTGRRTLGFKLPAWQRSEVWTDAQCVAFIESVWLGVGLGAYMVNWSAVRDDIHYVLLDGQQRLRAIERYWQDEIAVTGDDGHAYRWSELTEKEHAHFLRIPFPWIETQYQSDEEMREAYNRHNFGGTPHTEDQRA